MAAHGVSSALRRCSTLLPVQRYPQYLHVAQLLLQVLAVLRLC